MSACAHDSNKFPTAIPMFLRSSNMTALVQRLSYVRVIGISKMAAFNRKWINTTKYRGLRYKNRAAVRGLKSELQEN